jgi:hypothetical protein
MASTFAGLHHLGVCEGVGLLINAFLPVARQRDFKPIRR